MAGRFNGSSYWVLNTLMTPSTLPEGGKAIQNLKMKFFSRIITSWNRKKCEKINNFNECLWIKSPGINSERISEKKLFAQDLGELFFINGF